MSRNVALRELLVGIEGLALLRQLDAGRDEDAAARLAEVRRILDDASLAAAEPHRELEPRDGYDAWAGSYDQPGNPLVETEQRAMWGLVDALPAGRALDAACGTGRHAAHLVERGHEVVGVDLTPAMLRRAEARVPRASFREGDLRALPADADGFDLVTCGLALAHLPDLGPPLRELARVLAPGGSLFLSVLHPLQVHLGWNARFTAADGQRLFVREHPHGFSDYLGAFRAAGLRLETCLEPRLTEAQIPAQGRAFRHVPEATRAAYLGLPVALVWALTKPEP